MNRSKLTNPYIIHAFMDQFALGMANIGDISGGGVQSAEPPQTNTRTAWLDVSKSFRATGNDLRWAITSAYANE